jgi:transcriptional regulator with XRE-family HTH domain
LSPSLRTHFHEILATLIDSSPLTQREIAAKLGYSKPNIITMFKKGHTPVPIRQVPALARVLEVDPAWLVRLAMRSYHPEILDTVEMSMGFLATAREVEIIRELRELTGNTDPRLDDPSEKTKLGELAKLLTEA